MKRFVYTLMVGGVLWLLLFIWWLGHIECEAEKPAPNADPALRPPQWRYYADKPPDSREAHLALHEAPKRLAGKQTEIKPERSQP